MSKLRTAEEIGDAAVGATAGQYRAIDGVVWADARTVGAVAERAATDALRIGERRGLEWAEQRLREFYPDSTDPSDLSAKMTVVNALIPIQDRLRELEQK